MPTDLERALKKLTAQLDDRAPTISADEILTAVEDTLANRRDADRVASPRRWLILAAAAMVLIVGVAAAVVVGRGDGAVTTVPPATSIVSDAVIDMPPPRIDTIDAQVLGRSPDSSDARVEIDRGSAHGVVVGMPVVTAAGLVGEVTQVYPRTSIVTLLTGADVAVAAKSVSTRTEPDVTASGVVSGRGVDAHLRFDSLSGSLPRVGDSVLTVGGDNSLQPPDIPIGRIVNVTEHGTGDVELAAELSRLDQVQVLLYRPPDLSVAQQPESGSSTSADVTSPNTTRLPNVFVEDPLAPGAWSGARTSADGRSLLLFFVGAADYQSGDPCSMRFLPAVEETDAEVHVTIHGERPRAPEGSVSYGCRLIGYARSVTVELNQPFADRKLIVLGAERRVFDGATLAHANWIPDGWEEVLEQPAGLVDGSEAAAWARTWAPPSTTSEDGACVPGNSGFTLFEGPAGLLANFLAEPGETVVDTYDIRGATAAYSARESLGISRLSWIEGDRGYVLKAFPSCAGDQPPSIDTMLQFARNLKT